MHRTILTAAAAFVAGGVLTGAVLSYAQPAPSPAPQAITSDTAGMPPGNMPGGIPGGMRKGMAGGADGGHAWMRWHHEAGGQDGRPGGGPGGGPGHFAGGPVGGMRALALVFRQADRNLTPPDVQKIAEAFLLWNGNHTWKVVDTAALADGRIGFSLATADGSVIAKFAMDPHTARLVRVG